MTNSSDRLRTIPFEALSGTSGFRPSARFAVAATPQAASDNGDPLAEAQALGFSEGYAAGHAEAQAEAQAMLDAHGRLSLAFARLDQQMEEELRLALRETVAALCEEVLAPLAIEEEALLARIGRAVAMLSRSYDERTIRLHPDDLALLSDRLHDDWTIRPDPSLPRGSLRVESVDGGIEDGPETWRRAIAEALGPC